MTGDFLEPYLLAAGEGEPAATPQRTGMAIKASSELTGGAIGMLESADPPGFSTVLHTHEVAELWYILDGHYDYHVAGRWLSAEAGAVVFVPPRCPHGLRVGPSGGRKLTIFVPGGTEGLFREIHRRAEVGELTDETMRALARCSWTAPWS
ncbi:cupin domain-containing protein [Nonomuraea africana]|uniref:Quercetin dioxygenase-like cupin family protein n=1 Tax=Nonomuraea africana TaxID=46171 RepID=A0ABR9KB18_9ACTN|nr:cupin domain-containing protein [Nonomuraea africana]MBE1559001.1 quercetin dioxygenase-like cupin family protein [Nonomuraea africana]